MKACPQCNIRYPAESTFCFLDGATLVQIRDPLIGTTIAGRYKVEKIIGEGGMATVYRATQSHVDWACAIKVMNPAMASDATVRERFRREAKSAQVLAHPNIIEIFDQGETESGTPWMAMELLEGTTLAGLTEHERLPLGRGVPIMIQMARGIARAHDLGVVHRDLKPENMFVCSRPHGSDLVKILDFGIARSTADTRITNAGELFGTPQYLAPERITSGDAGPSVDLYALGCIFFEMATGKLPFEGPDPASLMFAHMKTPAPLARSVAPEVPERLEALIAQLLEKNPQGRPDARRVAHELADLARMFSMPVPSEAEQESASARAPLRTMPELVSLQWAKRVDVFEEMFAKANGVGAAAGLDRTLQSLRTLVAQVTETRATIGREHRKLEEIDARGREGRQRFGAAVDALGIDSSRAKGEVRQGEAEAQRWGGEDKKARTAYERAMKKALFWEGRSGMQEPYAELTAAYRACADAVDAWLEARKGERAAHDAVEEKTRVVGDLDYQIAELRAALAHHEEGIDRDREATRQRIVELAAEAERMERQLVYLATHFCEPLRARPELGPLFLKLEAEAVAQA